MPLYSFEGKTPKISDDTYIHPQATIIGTVIIGGKCFIGPGAVLRGDTGKIEVGDGTNLQDNCVIHADRKVVIANNIIIGHGAIIHDAILKPGVVVLGNMLSVAGGFLLPPMQEELNRHVLCWEDSPTKIVLGHHGYDACVMGGVVMVRQSILPLPDTVLRRF